MGVHTNVRGGGSYNLRLWPKRLMQDALGKEENRRDSAMVSDKEGVQEQRLVSKIILQVTKLKKQRRKKGILKVA